MIIIFFTSWHLTSKHAIKQSDKQDIRVKESFYGSLPLSTRTPYSTVQIIVICCVFRQTSCLPLNIIDRSFRVLAYDRQKKSITLTRSLSGGLLINWCDFCSDIVLRWIHIVGNCRHSITCCLVSSRRTVNHVHKAHRLCAGHSSSSSLSSYITHWAPTNPD